ncbi:MAG: hypothetical protein FWG89_06950 [Treponema sp.]|nr:hypothetical protein [Treponema sp.]
MSITTGQQLEIPFSGTGWVFTGEANARRGITYESRRPDNEGQSFIFRTELAGIYILRFYRQDYVRDTILNDQVQVIVTEAPRSAGSDRNNQSAEQIRVIAEPRWPSAIEGALRPESNTSPAVTTRPPEPDLRPSTSAVSPAPPASQPPAPDPAPSALPTPPLPPASPEPADSTVLDTSPEAYLQRAREEFNADRFASVIAILDQFRERYPSGSDEAWWLYGQSYEANSPSRNVLLSLEYYRRLVREFPQSSRAAEARRRISFLERFFINIQ